MLLEIYNKVEELRAQKSPGTLEANVLNRVSLSLAIGLDTRIAKRFLRYERRHGSYPEELPTFYTQPEEIDPELKTTTRRAILEGTIAGLNLPLGFFIERAISPFVAEMDFLAGLGVTILAVIDLHRSFNLERIQIAQDIVEDLRRNRSS